MDRFDGFPPGKQVMTLVPNPFFADLLPQIDDLDELKLTLYAFYALQQQEGEHRYLIAREVLADERLLAGLDADPARAAERTQAALTRTVERGTLLHAQVQGQNGSDDLYFMNTARGRTAVQAIAEGRFEYGGRDCPVALVQERPNVYALYEANIGPLTPLLGDQLRDAETEFSAEWIAEAIQIAVERNARNWRYILGILKRWQSEGKDRGTAQKSTQADRYRYIQGDYADFIEH